VHLIMLDDDIPWPTACVALSLAGTVHISGIVLLPDIKKPLL
jgi:hypothetical protein